MSSRATGQALPDGPYVGYRTTGARVAGHLFTGVWLLYLVGCVVDLFTRHYGAAYQWGGLALIVVFSVIYMLVVPNWAYAPSYALPTVGALSALAIIGSTEYGAVGASTMWIFVSSSAGLLVVNRRLAVQVVLAIGACYTIFSVIGHVDKETLVVNLFPAVLIGLSMIGLRRQFQLTAELARARQEVAQLAVSEERLRLARDLHDLTGQSLSMITLKSELAAKLLRRLPAGSDRDRALAESEEVAAVSRQTLHDIRDAISGYRRPTLAVEIITARTALEAAGVTINDDPGLTLLSGTVDAEAEAALAWCLREATTNVIRHSGASHCRVSLKRRDGCLRLVVHDDGGGLTDSDATGGGPGGQAGARAGTGLRGMSERLSALGGHLEVRPSPRGFRLVASVPEDSVPGDGGPADGGPGDGADMVGRAGVDGCAGVVGADGAERRGATVAQ
jgi:two-component system sensor histidine kinase DesK